LLSSGRAERGRHRGAQEAGVDATTRFEIGKKKPRGLGDGGTSHNAAEWAAAELEGFVMKRTSGERDRAEPPGSLDPAGSLRGSGGAAATENLLIVSPLSSMMWTSHPRLSRQEHQMTTMRPLRRRMIEDMTIRNLSRSTQQFHVYAVATFKRGAMRPRAGAGGYFLPARRCIPRRTGAEAKRRIVAEYDLVEVALRRASPMWRSSTMISVAPRARAVQRSILSS